MVLPLLGAHLSIAGGYHKAAEAAARLGMGTVQIFTGNPRQFPKGQTAVQSGGSLTKNNAQWRAKPLADEDIQRFAAAVAEAGLCLPCAHASYLINLASPDDELWQRSVEAFVVELDRAAALGLAGLVVHPGSFVASSEDAGLRRVVQALDECVARTAERPAAIWLETTAGQGTNLGWRFEHLQQLIETAADGTRPRLGVCVDTCHVFAAGYPLGTPDEYEETIRRLHATVGLDRVRAWHLNDSKKPLGSRVDRHEHIGDGCLGVEPFRHLLSDPRFADRPMYLETPKGRRDGQDLDAINLAVLRGLIRPDAPKTSPQATGPASSRPAKNADAKSQARDGSKARVPTAKRTPRGSAP